MARTFRSLSDPAFRWYAAASLMTNTAMWMQRIGQDWLAIQLTGDGVAVGITTALQFLPALVIAPIAGMMADRLPRRMLLVLNSLCMALPSALLGLIVLGGGATIHHVYGFALVLGLISAVDGPVRQAYIRDLMREGDFVNAIGLSGVIFHTSRIIGPALAGLVIAAVGVAFDFMAVACAYVLAAAVLFFIRVRPQAPAAHTEGRPGIAGALHLLRGQPGLLAIMGLTACVSAFAGNFQVLLTIMATKGLGLGAGEFGLLTSMMAIGSISGALQVARLERPGYARILLASALLGGAYLLASAARTPVQFGLCLLPIGMLSNTYLSTANSVVQLRVPTAFQGRVAGLYSSGGYALVPVGAIAIGLIADHLSPKAPLTIAGLLCACAAAVALLALRMLDVVHWQNGRLVETERASGPGGAQGRPIIDNPV